VGYGSVPLGAWSPSIDWKSVVLSDFNFDGRLERAGLAQISKRSDSDTWWAGLTRRSGIDTEVWGRFGVENGGVVSKAPSTTTR
jgi:hypothetical protein